MDEKEIAAQGLQGLLADASDTLLEISVAAEKAKTMICILNQEYLGIDADSEAGPYLLMHYHQKARIQSDIQIDYITEVNAKLAELEKIIGAICKLTEKGELTRG